MESDDSSRWAGLILAGGVGSRMHSSVPKPLHKLCGITLLEHVVRRLRAAGVSSVVIVGSKAITDHPGTSELLDKLDAKLVIQEHPAGTADALKCGLAVTGDSQVIVAPADMPLVEQDTLSRMIARHSDADAPVITLLTAHKRAPHDLGRVRRDHDGNVARIVEAKHLEGAEANLQADEVNVGWYCLQSEGVAHYLSQCKPSPGGELYLTDVVELAARESVVTAVECHEEEALGINDRQQLADCERVLIRKRLEELMSAGVTVRDLDNTYVDVDVSVGMDTEILAGSHIKGATRIGRRALIGPNALINNTNAGDEVSIAAAHVEDAVIGDGVTVGPFSRVRGGTVIDKGARVGNHVEIKNSRIGAGTHISHFSYIGDADLGRNVNIGAGTVTCNFDGARKHRTEIADNAFIGSGTMLVAPVKVGANAKTGAGAVVTKAVADGDTVVGIPARSKLNGKFTQP